MKYYATIDTNVIVSALLKENSIPWQIIELIVDEIITPIYSKDILEEYEEVLSRNKFGFPKVKIKIVISLIKDFGIEMDPIEIKENFKDKGDIKFYQIVLSSRRYDYSYLITGNIRHFPKDDFVVTPREMLQIIQKDKETKN